METTETAVDGEIDPWDTCLEKAYESKILQKYGSRRYCMGERRLESFALSMWIAQEKLHLDVKDAFLVSNRWRSLSSNELENVFGGCMYRLLNREKELML